MTNSIEIALRQFSRKGGLHGPSAGRRFNALGGEEFIGALQVAAKSNPHGLEFLMADHLSDEGAIQGLLAHFCTTLGK
ncbi:hypothetical protein [Aeromonas hydrophila]|uniref:hypothetical protein n=1 Tax=Aeromonas hydrophila TaxID=644 RepID=UPI0030D0D9F4